MNKEVLDFLRKHVGRNAAELPSSMGLGRWLNARLEALEDDGHVRLSFEVRDDMLNPLGMVHGGAFCAIVDEVMGMQLYLLNEGGNPFVSIGLHIDFLHKCLPGDRIVAVPRLTRIGRTTAHLTCDLFSENSGKLFVKASSSFSRLPSAS